MSVECRRAYQSSVTRGGRLMCWSLRFSMLEISQVCKQRGGRGGGEHRTAIMGSPEHTGLGILPCYHGDAVHKNPESCIRLTTSAPLDRTYSCLHPYSCPLKVTRGRLAVVQDNVRSLSSGRDIKPCSLFFFMNKKKRKLSAFCMTRWNNMTW